MDRSYSQTTLTRTILKALRRAKTLTKDGSNKMDLGEYLEYQQLIDRIEKEELDVRLNSRVD